MSVSSYFYDTFMQLSEQDEQNSTMVQMKAELSDAISGKLWAPADKAYLHS